MPAARARNADATVAGGGLVAVGHGVDAGSLPGATPFGTTPAATPESVSFVLRERNLPALESTVEGGGHADLSVAQFAQAYGRSPNDIYQLEVYLAAFGIRSQSYADDLDVSATGTAGQFDQALSVRQLEYRVPGYGERNGTAGVPAQIVHSPTGPPTLPARIAREVLTVLGLTDYSSLTSQAVHVPSGVTQAQPTSANSCIKLTGSAADCNLPSNFDADYGLKGLVAHGASGAGQTLGIVTLAALDPGAAQYYWTHVARIPATGRTLTVDNVDGGPGRPATPAGAARPTWTSSSPVGWRRMPMWWCTRHRTPTAGSPTRSSTRPVRTWPGACRPAGRSPRRPGEVVGGLGERDAGLRAGLRRGVPGAGHAGPGHLRGRR